MNSSNSISIVLDSVCFSMLVLQEVIKELLASFEITLV